MNNQGTTQCETAFSKGNFAVVNNQLLQSVHSFDSLLSLDSVLTQFWLSFDSVLTHFLLNFDSVSTQLWLSCDSVSSQFSFCLLSLSFVSAEIHFCLNWGYFQFIFNLLVFLSKQLLFMRSGYTWKLKGHVIGYF